MRYTGQGWEIPIQLTADEALNPTVETFKRRFEEDYSSLFGRTVEGMDIEITVWAVNATTPAQAVTKVSPRRPGQAAAIDSHRSIFDAALNKSVDASIVLRGEIQDGQTVQGPAAITEDETTIILPSSRRAIRQPDGCIDINTVAQGT